MDARLKTPSDELWRRRLTLAAYPVKDAARYAHISTQTVRNWQRKSDTAGGAIAPRDPGRALSYYQLQELAVVSAMRQRGVSLTKIRTARDYLGARFNLEFPFADRRVKTDGQDILLELREELGNAAVTLLVANKGGQIVWAAIIGQRFDEFEYVGNLALKWKVAGVDSTVTIDPRVSFGAPAVRGVPTWTLRGRWLAGESIGEIAQDFMLDATEVVQALRFENVDPNNNKNRADEPVSA